MASKVIVLQLKTMALGRIFIILLGSFSLLVGKTACTNRTPASIPELNLSLQSGIDLLAKLGDTEGQTYARSQFPSERIAIEPESELGQLRFTHYLHFASSGVKTYFRSGRVALIEIQDPFHGNLVGQTTRIFPFARNAEKTWEEVLIRDFGTPNDRSAGGRLSSDLLLYNWGDIAYNGLGPNQIALYRDFDIAEYRKRNFGRVIRFWK